MRNRTTNACALSLEPWTLEPSNPLFLLMPVPFPLPENYLYRRLVKP